MLYLIALLWRLNPRVVTTESPGCDGWIRQRASNPVPISGTPSAVWPGMTPARSCWTSSWRFVSWRANRPRRRRAPKWAECAASDWRATRSSINGCAKRSSATWTVTWRSVSCSRDGNAPALICKCTGACMQSSQARPSFVTHSRRSANPLWGDATTGEAHKCSPYVFGGPQSVYSCRMWLVAYLARSWGRSWESCKLQMWRIQNT